MLLDIFKQIHFIWYFSCDTRYLLPDICYETLVNKFGLPGAYNTYLDLVPSAFHWILRSWYLRANIICETFCTILIICNMFLEILSKFKLALCYLINTCLKIATLRSCCTSRIFFILLSSVINVAMFPERLKTGEPQRPGCGSCSGLNLMVQSLVLV